MLPDAASAAAGAATVFRFALGRRRAKIISRPFEFAGRDPLNIFGDWGIAMHADAAFGAGVVEGDVRQHRFAASRAVGYRK